MSHFYIKACLGPIRGSVYSYYYDTLLQTGNDVGVLWGP